MTKLQLCEAQPDLSGALFVIAIGEKFNLCLTFFAMTKKRERKADKAAQIITVKEMRPNIMPGLRTSINLFMMNYYL